MGTWQLQQAKARLSEVIVQAEREGPQIITRRGIETAVIVPLEEWKRKQSRPGRTMLDILRGGPEGSLPLPPRRATRTRKVPEL